MTSLAPSPGSSWLSVASVVERADAEFDFVFTDQARAMKYLAEQLLAATPDLDQQAADDYLRPLAEAVQMICTDDRRSDDCFLKCIVMPKGPIEILYHDDAHKNSSADLLERLALALGYVVEK